MAQQRGYFGLGVEGLSKPMNAGSLMRTAHSFGASFVFAVSPFVDMRGIRHADTSRTADQVPYYQWDTPAGISLPRGCALVGVELVEDSIALPSFRHPERAAYILGPERGSLSPEMIARCDFVVQIPIAFCVNVGIAGAIVLYDRMISRGRYAERPVKTGGPVTELAPHIHGEQVFRTKRAAKKPVTAKPS
ncbi:MAG: RNA methyltransferase [Alphaproteobacteria bacterium]|nr:RNA methyltransferase [Alphaproteobacteria bacterium]